MNIALTIAPVRKSIRVVAPQTLTFDTFTAGIGRWWPLDHGVGPKPRARVAMETHVGGRWYEVSEGGVETTVGRILVWEPPQRFVMTWDIDSTWKPDTTVASEVEVRFRAEGPGVTIVDVEHRKFEALGAEGGEKLRKDVDGGWPGMLALVKAAAEQAV